MAFSFLFCIFAAKIVLNKQNMKQFNLGEYLKNPLRKVVTRDGRNVKIHCTDYLGIQPIFATIEGDAYPSNFCKNGRYMINEESPRDLFFATEKREGWINLYENEDGISWISPNYFTSKKGTEEEGKTRTCRVTTIKIEWEE